MNHYERLGVGASATQDEIKQAFRKLSKSHHPDAGGDEAAYKAISEAYQTLKDPARRRQYDAEQLMQHQTRGSADPRGWGIDLDDLFAGVFRQQAQRSRDIIVKLALTPQEIYQGVSNRKLKTRYGEFTVAVPPGLRPGSTLSYDGIVPGATPETPRGALTVQITSADDDKWQIHGDDVYHILDVDCLDAITGSEVEFTHLDGVARRVRIPPGTQHGKRLRLAGLGLQRPSERVQGDLYAVVNLIVPLITDQNHLTILKNIKRRYDP
jgi:curved DNA-binding protein